MKKKEVKDTQEQPKKVDGRKGHCNNPAGRPRLYSRENLLQRCLDYIASDPDVVFWCDLIAEMEISSKTFYEELKVGTEAHEIIQQALNKNKTALKKKLRKRFLDLNNPTSLVVLYKLIGDEDERRALSVARKQEPSEPINANIELKFT